MSNKSSWPVPELRTAACNLFTKLLRACYNLPIQITSWDELIDLAQLADYYGMLRSLSSSVGCALLGSKDLFLSLPPQAYKVLPWAAKLRCASLFRDCVTLCLGPATNPQYDSIKDSSLKPLLYRLAIAQAEKRKKVRDELRAYLPRIIHAPYTQPDHFRRIQHKIEREHEESVFGGLLDHGLILVPAPKLGERHLRDYFLNVKLLDEDLTWDEEEMDW